MSLRILLTSWGVFRHLTLGCFILVGEQTWYFYQHYMKNVETIFLKGKYNFLWASRYSMGRSLWVCWSWLLGYVKIGLFLVCLYFQGICLLTGNSPSGVSGESQRCLSVCSLHNCALNSNFCLFTTASRPTVSVQLFCLSVLLFGVLVSHLCVGNMSVNTLMKVICRISGSCLDFSLLQPLNPHEF